MCVSWDQSGETHLETKQEQAARSSRALGVPQDASLSEEEEEEEDGGGGEEMDVA